MTNDKDCLDRAVQVATLFIAFATLVGAAGAVWAAVAAMGAWQEAQKQVNIASTAASDERRATLVETSAPLAIQCPFATARGTADGVWTFYANGTSGFIDSPQPFVSSGATAALCRVTNYGRVPALLVTLHFAYYRTSVGICDLVNASAFYGHDTEKKLFSTKDLPILGIPAGGTYMVGLRAVTRDFIFINLPDAASYQTPAESKPTEKALLRFGEAGITLQSHGENPTCFKHSRR
jgi:hypothetical protein